MPSIRDWQWHGVELKVELATSGSLIVGGNQTDWPFTTGGEYGAPYGWDAGEYSSGNAGNEGAYNWTTSAGVFSVSPKTTPTVSRSAGIWGQPFSVIPGRRYQVGCQVRQMAGKATSVRSVTLERSKDKVSWTYFTGSQGLPALTDWEDVLVTSVAALPEYVWGRLYLLGGPPITQLVNWGVQFQNLYVNELDLAPDPIEWTDVTCDVRDIAVRYGRERFTNRYDVSTLQLDLLNTEGKYSYHNPHPLGLRPGRQVRVTATYKGVTYPVAFHVLDSIVDAFSMDGQVISRWQCVDPTSVLSNANVQTTQGSIGKGGTRINQLLDQIGYIPRLIDAGNWNMQGIAASGRSIRDEAGLTADSEGGNFFADRQGNCVYKDRDWRAEDSNLREVTADIVAYPHPGGSMPIVDQVPTKSTAPIVCVNEYVTDWSLARVINMVSLANAGGTAQEFIDEESFKAYGPATYQRHDFVLWSDSDLSTRAADIMGGYSDPVLRVNSVSFAPGQSVAWEWTLGAFLNWLVRVWYTHPTNYWGYAVCVHIQSIEHRISPTDWTTSLTVDLPESFAELEWLSANGWDQGEWDLAIWDQGEEPVGALWDNGYRWDNPTTKWGA